MVKLDRINNKIIAELLNNCRQSNIQLGKKIGLSREGIANRIRRLEQEGIITGYGIEINFSKLGFIPHEVSIKFESLNLEDEKKIISFFNQNKKIVFVDRSFGKFDYFIMFMVKSIAELDLEIDKLRDIFKTKIKTIDISAWVANYDTISSIFSNKPIQAISKQEINEQSHKLNKLETRLLIELSKNSRESAINLSAKLNTSAITISNKLKKLYKTRVIKMFRARINFEKLGLQRHIILLNIVGDKIEQRLSEYCKNNNKIADLTKFIGKYNYIIEVLTKNNTELRTVMEDLLNYFKKLVIESETLILFEEIKHIPFYE